MNIKESPTQSAQAASGLVGYFDQQVLASYRNEPNKFTLEDDSFEGTLTLTQSYAEELEINGSTNGWLSFRFGYRALDNGTLAIALWLQDLMEAGDSHQSRWMGFKLTDPTWATSDERFERWFKRYIEGSWEVDNGPKFKLAEIVANINAFTNEIVGHELYSYAIDSSLMFPTGENSHCYQDAHARLYGILIDGLNKRCIEALAEALQKPMNTASSKTLQALERVLPELATSSAFKTAMSTVSQQRGFASHGKRLLPIRTEAFSMFTQDLELCLKGLQELFASLEKHLGVDGLSAIKRSEARKRLPRIHQTQYSSASIHEAPTLEGKTITCVEYGNRETIKGVHESEALILHFSDGSIMCFDTGSNAYNVASKFPGLNPEELHVRFHLSWVPPIPTKRSQTPYSPHTPNLPES